VDLENALSRPRAAAERLAGVAEDAHRFVDKRVLLTGDAEVLRTSNGAWAMESGLLLLLRICPSVVVAVPDRCASLRAQLEHLAARTAFGRPVSIVERADPAQFDAALSVGVRGGRDLTAVVNSNGWLARVATGERDLGTDCGQPNPIASLFASSLGVSEIFKQLLPVRAQRAKPMASLEFSLYSLRTADSDPGPRLPASLPLRAMLVGAGAIGNGVVYVVSRLPMVGDLSLIDYQDYGEENLGTCLLIGPADIGQPKALALASHGRNGLRIRGFSEDLAHFQTRLGEELPHPTIVLSAVDSVAARHAIQDLWPDLVINGAIGDFPCEVSRHPWGEDVACMRCIYQEPPGERSEVVQSRLTGLPTDRLQDLTRELQVEDIAAAVAEKQVFLQPWLGRQLCSILDEAMARYVADEQLRPGFEPSVPFVATMAAALMVGELVKSLVGWPTDLAPRFQFDSLIGPQAGQAFPEPRRASCVCRARRDNIERVRRDRQNDGAG
jgi:molybdopterin/thiamine biosynthesis adenylyltransferase